MNLKLLRQNSWFSIYQMIHWHIWIYRKLKAQLHLLKFGKHKGDSLVSYYVAHIFLSTIETRLNLWTIENLRHTQAIFRGFCAFGQFCGVKFAT